MMRTIQKAMAILALTACLFTGESLVAPLPIYAASSVIYDPANDKATTAEWGARLAAMAKKSALLGQVISLLSSIYNIVDSGFSAMNDLVNKDAKLNVASQEGLALTKQELAQSVIDNDTQDTLLAAQLKLVADHVTPKNDYLCKAILLNQLPSTTEDFEIGVARVGLKVVESLYRGPLDDANGPLYAFDEEALRCAAGFGNSPVDAYDLSCSDTVSTIGATKRSFIDADITPFSMDGAVVLELPQFTAKAITLPGQPAMTVNFPDPQNGHQRMWVAGLHYCVQLAMGARSTPAWGASKMTTPQGLVERARFDHALAMQSAMTKPCTDLLAYYTRPDSKEPSSKALIDAQQESCLAAKGYISDEDMKEKFSDCLSSDFKGLSAYQAELLSHSICKSEQHYLSALHSGETHAEAINETIKCSLAWNTWQAKIAAKQGGLVDAVAGLQETKSNWAGVGRDVAEGAMPDEERPHRVVKDSRSKNQPVIPQEIKAQITPSFPQKGVPFAADEVAWPVAVSQ